MRCLILLSCLVAVAHGAIYFANETIIGHGFYDSFAFENISDPTHGRVQYVDQDSALALNLTYATHRTFILRTDTTGGILTPDMPGRKSVRLHSRTGYGVHVAVFDVVHMPQGCATWPAIWERGPSPWPAGGEIDVMEGINDEAPNLSSLHTSPNCTVPNPSTLPSTGNITSTNCDAKMNSNQGCGVQPLQPNSYGPDFNAAGGGWYALERSKNTIRLWFWTRHSLHIPLDVRLGLPVVDTTFWGPPYAVFESDTCDIDSKFGAMQIIINITLCGDWAGNKGQWAAQTCASQDLWPDCKSFVNGNPQAFVDSYWQFNAIHVYIPPKLPVLNGTDSTEVATATAT